MHSLLRALLFVTSVFFLIQLPSNSLPLDRLNVLMISIDDLRTEISVYPEGAHVHTPNMQQLATRSLVFDRAYVQVAVCMPSRTALLTSRRPDTSRSWTIEPDQYWRKSGGNFTTLPQAFKEAGYFVCGMGKVFHDSPKMSANQDVNYSWSPECIIDDSEWEKKQRWYLQPEGYQTTDNECQTPYSLPFSQRQCDL